MYNLTIHPHSSHPSQALWNLPRPLSRHVTFGGRGIPCRFPMNNSYLKEESSMKKPWNTWKTIKTIDSTYSNMEKTSISSVTTNWNLTGTTGTWKRNIGSEWLTCTHAPVDIGPCDLCYRFLRKTLSVGSRSDIAITPVPSSFNVATGSCKQHQQERPLVVSLQGCITPNLEDNIEPGGRANPTQIGLAYLWPNPSVRP